MKYIYLVIHLLIFQVSFTQNIGINSSGNAPDNSAMLDVESNNKGLLIPRLNSVQRVSIPLPATGLLVYDTDSSSLFIFSQSFWRKICPAFTINNLIQGNNAGDILVWNGTQWNLTPKCQLFSYQFRDNDNDGYGNKYLPLFGCSPFPGFVSDSTDINDNNSLIH